MRGLIFAALITLALGCAESGAAAPEAQKNPSMEERVQRLEQFHPTPTPSPIPAPTPDDAARALSEFARVTENMASMMTVSGLDALPNPRLDTGVAPCAIGTNDMRIFPDISTIVSGAKVFDAEGRAFTEKDADGYVLHLHDAAADGGRDMIVLIEPHLTEFCYTVVADGTIQQYTEAGVLLR